MSGQVEPIQRDRRPPVARFATCPAVPAALWLGLGIAAVLLATVWAAPQGTWLLPVAAGVGLLVVCAPGRERLLALFFPLGCLLAALHLWAPWQTYLDCLPRPEVGADIRVVVAGADSTAEGVEWPRGSLRTPARMRAMRIGQAEPWQPCRGRILLLLPPGMPAGHGDELELQGAFIEPEGVLSPGGFDYRRFLRTGGVQHLFAVTKRHHSAPPQGWRRWPATLYALRDRAAARLAAQVQSDTHRRVLLAMTLGRTRGLDATVRRRFLESGAVHLFAISGLHVGIVAGIALFALRAVHVPYRLRYALLPFLLGLYVLATGAAPSAVRAWLMLTAWALAQAALRPAVPLNAVAMAALVLLVITPLNLAHPGFQFSFTIVSVLILGWPLMNQASGIMAERRLWIPRRLRRQRFAAFLGSKGFQALGGGVLAWLGSAGLIAWANGLFIPAALLVNVAISLLAWLVLALAGPKIAVGLLGIDGLGNVLAFAIERLLDLIHAAVELGSRPGGSMAIVRPTAWVVVAYYVCLFTALLPPAGRCPRAPANGVGEDSTPPGAEDAARAARARGRLRGLAGGAAALLLGAMVVRRVEMPRLVLFHGGESAVPAMILGADSASGPVVINTGGPQAARDIADWLRARGCREIDALVLSAGSWAASGGASHLIATMQVRTLIAPSAPTQNAMLAEALLLQAEEGRRVRVLERSRSAAGMVLTMDRADVHVVAINRDGGQTLAVRRRDARGNTTVETQSEQTGKIRVRLLDGDTVLGETTLLPARERHVSALAGPRPR